MLTKRMFMRFAALCLAAPAAAPAPAKPAEKK